jgi:phenylacetate-coenzyme A ligase PaaK-like adenylate-forming protein
MARGIRASKELVERERWPRERLKRFQQERLEDLIRYAAAHSRFWRERLPADVREFQVVQQGEALRLRVCLRDGAGEAPARLRARVGARLEELGVPRPSVEVETVDALERSPAGKLQVVVAGPRS